MSDMNVTMDPRVMKELLMSQFLSGIDPFAGTGLSADGTDSDGSGLFSQLLGQLTGADALTDIGLGFGSGLDSGANSPDSLSMLQLLGAGSGLTGAGLGLSGLGGGLSADDGFTSSFDGLITAAASRYGVDPALVKSVIQTESSFRPDAVSSAGAKGLMQLMDGTARGLGVTDSFDPAQNIDAGTRYLSYLLRKYDGNAATALAAYNAGPGAIDRLGLKTNEDVAARLAELPGETQSYIRKVLQAKDSWSASL
ncbi:lytic transglycosylase domain-containing protein [Cohnella zeiphila]|nr:lytic transglycosylase domain-containing protein [Cohnella zeiphila]